MRGRILVVQVVDWIDQPSAEALSPEPVDRRPDCLLVPLGERTVSPLAEAELAPKKNIAHRARHSINMDVSFDRVQRGQIEPRGRRRSGLALGQQQVGDGLRPWPVTVESL